MCNFFCAGKKSTQTTIGWTVSMIVFAGLVALAVGGYVVYKYRLRVCVNNILTDIYCLFESSCYHNCSLLNTAYNIFWCGLCGNHVQSYMDSEIRAIMAQYMPLDSQTEVNNHMQEEIWFWYVHFHVDEFVRWPSEARIQVNMDKTFVQK